jgi:hypothetical protein
MEALQEDLDDSEGTVSAGEGDDVHAVNDGAMEMDD